MSAIKRAIIVGAGSGIGREAATLLSECGCEVVLSGRSEGPLLALEALLRDAGRSAHAVVCDVRSDSDCSRLVAISREIPSSPLGRDRDAEPSEAERREGIRRFEPILVNCVGIAKFQPFEKANLGDLRDQVETNLMGAIRLCRVMIPWMLEQGRGHVLNVSSVAAVQPFPNSGAYGATKAGMLMLTKTLAAEYRDRGIRFSCLLPGSVDTPLWERQSFSPAPADMLSPQAVAEVIRDIVMSPPDRSYDEVLLMPPKGLL